jgi:hypothetical protein
MARRPNPQLADDLLFEVPHDQLSLGLGLHAINASDLCGLVQLGVDLKPLGRRAGPKGFVGSDGSSVLRTH